MMGLSSDAQVVSVLSRDIRAAAKLGSCMQFTLCSNLDSKACCKVQPKRLTACHS